MMELADRLRRSKCAAGPPVGPLAVDASGSFHPTWVDNRSGLAQIWSAAITVDGTVLKNGDPELATLDDVSKMVALDLSQARFDRTTGRLTFTAQLRNTSEEVVEGPIKVRVLTIESEIGIPEIMNADNGQYGTGGVWDFSGALAQGKLTSRSISTPKTLTFRLSELRPLGQGKEYKSNLLNLDTRVFGKLRKKSNAGEQNPN